MQTVTLGDAKAEMAAIATNLFSREAPPLSPLGLADCNFYEVYLREKIMLVKNVLLAQILDQHKGTGVYIVPT